MSNPTGPRLTLQDVRIQLPLQTENGSPIILQSPQALFTAGGITAVVKASESQPVTWNTNTGKFTGNLSGTFSGFAFALQDFSVALVKNALVAGGGTGLLRLPFFDQTLSITAALAQGGGWHLALATTPDKPVQITLGTTTYGLAIDLTSIELDAASAGPATLGLGGTAVLTLGGEASEPIPLQGLKISADGTVQLPGGWLPLQKAVTVKLGAFELTVSRLGFKTLPDGSREIALDAAVKLSTSMPAGASAKGLRLRFDKAWNYQGLSFDGIGVDFTIPGVLHFVGDVAMNDQGADTTFEGAVKVALFPIDAFVGGQVRFGSTIDAQGNASKYFAIKLDLELSRGIEIFGTGLSVYGLTGLFAYNYAPNKAPDRKWFAIPDGKSKPGWLQESPPGVAELAKWAPKPGTLAFGAGVTVGTSADDGKAFCGNFLLLITLPGPVVFLDGRANLMKDRRELKKEAAFRAYATLDGLAGSLLFGLDARWRYPEGGELIDISGSSEAFFDFHDASKWSIKLGLESPESARIKAKLVSFLEANAFLLIDAKHVRTGGKFGYSLQKKWGPLDVGVQFAAAAVADISWSPAQLHAEASVAGALWAKAFGYGISGSVSAGVAVDAFRPFHVLAKGTASGSIPIYGSFSQSVAVAWTQPPNTGKQQKPLATAKDRPLVAAPLASLSAAHAQVPVTWPLELAPKLADAQGYLAADWAVAKPLDLALPPPEDMPVLPLDARFDLCFARPVADSARVAVVGSAEVIPEIIGDPSGKSGKPIATVSYEVKRVELSRWEAQTGKWVAAAGQVVDGNGKAMPVGERPMYGAWLPEPGKPGLAQRRLRLWSVDPLEALASPSGVQAQAAAQKGPGLAALQPATTATTLIGFSSFLGPVQAAELSVGGPAMPQFAWSTELSASVAAAYINDAWTAALTLAPAANATTSAQLPRSEPLTEAQLWNLPAAAAAPPPPVVLSVALAQQEVTKVQVALGGAVEVAVWAFSADGMLLTTANWQPGQAPMACSGPVASVILVASGPIVVSQIAVEAKSALGPQVSPQAASDSVAHLAGKLGLFKAPSNVLPAHARLRLVVDVAVAQTPRSDLGDGKVQAATVTQVAYFRTEGGPGLADLALPTHNGQVDIGQALTDGAGALVTLAGEATTAPSLRTPINGLAPYIAASWPPTPIGTAPTRVWRACEVGFDFAVGHVRALYQASRRDLAIRVRDRSGAPLRDVRGRMLRASRGWLADVDGASDANQQAMLEKWQKATGLAIDPKKLGLRSRIRLTDTDLPATAGLVAELVPLLLAEPWAIPADSAPEGWSSIGCLGGASSKWQVAAYAGLQTVDSVAAGSTAQPVPGGSALVWSGLAGTAHPAWTDVAVSVQWHVFPAVYGDGWAGLTVRCDATLSHGLLFALQPKTGWRRLVQVVGGKPLLLAEDRCGIKAMSGLLSVTVSEGRIEAACDGEVAFSVAAPNSLAASGSVALWTAGPAGAAFSDLAVEDLSSACPVLHRHDLSTMAFRNLQHLAATGPVQPDQPGTIATGWPAPKASYDFSAAVDLTAKLPPPKSGESANADALFAAVAGQFDTLRSPRSGLDVLRGKVGAGEAQRQALLLRWPDNLDWQRLALQVATCPKPWPATRPDRARIGLGHWQNERLTAIDVTWLQGSAADGATLETLDVSDPLDGADRDGPSYVLPRSGPPTGLLWREQFGQGSLQPWSSVPARLSPGWQVDAAGKPQFTAQSGDVAAAMWAPTVAVADLRVAATFVAAASGSLGLVLRQGAPDSAGPGETVGIAVTFAAKSGDTPAKLALQQHWLTQDGQAQSASVELWLPAGTPKLQQLEVLASGSAIAVFFNGDLAGLYQDPRPQPGRCGLWQAGAANSTCTAFDVSTLSTPLLRNAFVGLDPATAPTWTAGTSSTPAAVWSEQPGAAAEVLPGLTGSASPVQFAAPGPAPDPAAPDPAAPDPVVWQVVDAPAAGDATAVRAGSVLPLPNSAPQAGRAEDWLLVADVRIQSGGVAGIAAEWLDGDNCALFALDTAATSARLVAVAQGKVDVGNAAPLSAAVGPWQRLAVRVCGRHVSAWADGKAAAEWTLAAERSGPLALFATGAAKVEFRNVALLDLTPSLAGLQTVPATWTQPAAPAAPRGTLALREGRLTAAYATGKSEQFALAGADGWDDYALEVTVRLAGDAFGLVVLRWTDADHWLGVSLTPYAATLLLNGKQVPGGKCDFNPLLPVMHHTLRAVVSGNRVRLAVSGWQFDTTVASPPGGQCGVRLAAGAAAWVDAFEVRPATPPELATWTTASGGASLEGWKLWTAPGAVDGPAAWTRQGDAIVQTSNVWGDSDKAPTGVPEFAMRGTVLWAAPVASGALRVGVTVQSDDKDALGLQLGAAPDDEHWVRFSLDQERQAWRVVRKQADQFELLWSRSAGCAPGTRYRLALAQDSDGLRGWVDGVPAFWLPGVSEPLPCVGLYCWANSSAKFTDLSIIPGPWRRSDRLLSDTFSWQDAGTWTASPSATSAFSWTDSHLAVTGPAAGSQRLVAGREKWADYRTTLAIRRKGGPFALAVASGPAGEVQVRVDCGGPHANHWQILWVSALPSAGAAPPAQPLAVAAADTALPVGKVTTVAIDVWARGVRLWQDGVLVASAVLTQEARGQVALIAESGSSAQVLGIRVDQANWRGLAHVNDPVPDGATLTVGPAATGPAAPVPASTVPAVAGRTWPSAAPLRLRVRRQDGTVDHAAWLQPPVPLPLPCKVMRGRAGSEVAILEPEPGKWPVGAAMALQFAWSAEPGAPGAVQLAKVVIGGGGAG